MRVLLDDTFATGTYTVPISLEWVSTPESLAVELVRHLSADTIAPSDSALVPASELRKLQTSHDVISDIAVIADGAGAIAMRTPVRPDEIDATPVRLLDAGGAAELLARATLHAFYGIAATNLVRDENAPDAPLAQVVIVEGAEALREPEAGFSEDLSRAWFILTAQPVVTHVFVAPRDLPDKRGRDIAAFLDAARIAGVARRSDWRPQLADREGVGRDRASMFWAAQRLRLNESDRRALLDLLAKGSRGTSSASPLHIRFRQGAGAK